MGTRPAKPLMAVLNINVAPEWGLRCETTAGRPTEGAFSSILYLFSRLPLLYRISLISLIS